MASHDRLITYDSKTLTLKQWAMRTGLSCSVISYRLKAGWSPHRIFNSSLDPRGRKRKLFKSALPLPALEAWHRDMYAQHRTLQRSIRAFIRDVENQMSELHSSLDQMIDEQVNSQASNAIPGEVANFAESASDQSLPSTQDTL